MPGMAKKKKEPAPDQHTSNSMVRLPKPLHELLKQAARMNQRPATWELKVALLKHFKELGMEIPPGLE